MTEFQTIEADLDGLTDGQILHYDSTAKKWVPVDSSSGLPDTEMPQLSAPTLQEIAGARLISWDGLDVDGAPPPEGFERAVLQAQQGTLSTTVTAQSFDTSQLAPTSPYVPDGFSVGANSGFAIDSGQLVSDGVSAGESSPVGNMNLIYLDGTDSLQFVGVASVVAVIASATDYSNGIFLSWDSAGTEAVEVGYKVNNDLGDLPDLDPAGNSVYFDGVTVTVLDHTGAVVFSAGTGIPHTGARWGIGLLVSESDAAMTSATLSQTAYDWEDGPVLDLTSVADTDEYDPTGSGWQVTDGGVAISGGTLVTDAAGGHPLLYYQADSYAQRVTVVAPADAIPTVTLGASDPTLDDVALDFGMAPYSPGVFGLFAGDNSSVDQFSWDPDGMTFTVDGAVLRVSDSTGTELASLGAAGPIFGMYVTVTPDIETVQVDTIPIQLGEAVEVASLVGAGSISADETAYYSWRARSLTGALGELSELAQLIPKGITFASLPDVDVSAYEDNYEATNPVWNGARLALQPPPPPALMSWTPPLPPGTPFDRVGGEPAGAFTIDTSLGLGSPTALSDGAQFSALKTPFMYLLPGVYEIIVDGWQYVDGGIVRMVVSTQGGGPVTFADPDGSYTLDGFGGALVDFYAAAPADPPSQEVTIGFLVTFPGLYSFNFTATAQNANSTGYRFGLYYACVQSAS